MHWYNVQFVFVSLSVFSHCPHAVDGMSLLAALSARRLLSTSLLSAVWVGGSFSFADSSTTRARLVGGAHVHVAD